MRRLFAVLGAGLAGAASLSILNELSRRLDPKAPRLELIGERALSAGMRRLGARRPHRAKLRKLAVLSDMLANSIVYGALFAGRSRPWQRGTLGGLLAGASALALAPASGIKRPLQAAPAATQLALARYLGAGLAASALYAAVTSDKSSSLQTQTLPISRAAL
jgi:hypothetical protein